MTRHQSLRVRLLNELPEFSHLVVRMDKIEQDTGVTFQTSLEDRSQVPFQQHTVRRFDSYSEAFRDFQNREHKFWNVIAGWGLASQLREEHKEIADLKAKGEQDAWTVLPVPDVLPTATDDAVLRTLIPPHWLNPSVTAWALVPGDVRYDTPWTLYLATTTGMVIIELLYDPLMHTVSFRTLANVTPRVIEQCPAVLRHEWQMPSVTAIL